MKFVENCFFTDYLLTIEISLDKLVINLFWPGFFQPVLKKFARFQPGPAHFKVTQTSETQPIRSKTRFQRTV